MKRSTAPLTATVLLLGMAVVAHGNEVPEGHLVVALSGGLAVPMGHFSDGYGTGGMGTLSLGLAGRRFGGRLLLGSVEPGTRGPTNDFYSAQLGSPVEVKQAIVPVELQGIAAFPSHTSRMALVLHAGTGFHNVTVRRNGTDDRLDHDNRFGYSAGAGVRRMVSANKPAISLGLLGVLHGSGASHYFSAELEVSFVI